MDYEELFLTAAVAAVIGFAAPAARAETRSVDERAQAAAQQGPDALRHFVWRTRMIHALDIQHYAAYLRTEAAGDADDGGAWTGLTFFDEPYTGAWLEAAGYAPAGGEGDDHE